MGYLHAKGGGEEEIQAICLETDFHSSSERCVQEQEQQGVSICEASSPVQCQRKAGFSMCGLDCLPTSTSPGRTYSRGFPGSPMGQGMVAVRALSHLAQALQACLDPAFLRDLSGSAPQLTGSSSVSWTKAIHLGNLYTQLYFTAVLELHFWHLQATLSVNGEASPLTNTLGGSCKATEGSSMLVSSEKFI